MPGVLVVEAMAQAGAILLLHDMPGRENKVVLFGGIDRARFRRPVVPGDRLVLKIECLRFRSRSSKMRGVAEVDGELAAEAEVLCTYGDREAT
jgi:3-hydroxyacyl-[acyl-carrier-protein] dehydratase